MNVGTLRALLSGAPAESEVFIQDIKNNVLAIHSVECFQINSDLPVQVRVHARLAGD
jgi:hypothetical protein